MAYRTVSKYVQAPEDVFKPQVWCCKLYFLFVFSDLWIAIAIHWSIWHFGNLVGICCRLNKCSVYDNVFLIYAVFGSILSLTAFFTRIYTTDLKISVVDTLKVIYLCFFEITYLRFALTLVRLTALVGYSKRKNQWGRIERKKINFKWKVRLAPCLFRTRQ